VQSRRRSRRRTPKRNRWRSGLRTGSTAGSWMNEQEGMLMNEQQLRQLVADTINAWVGSTRGSAGHREILQIYNAHTPLARGYKVQQGDAYCATTVSATWIKCGIADYTGTECSVGFLIAEAMKRGIWIERDDYVPKLGDAVCYYWSDSGEGDCASWPDHIGIQQSTNYLFVLYIAINSLLRPSSVLLCS